MLKNDVETTDLNVDSHLQQDDEGVISIDTEPLTDEIKGIVDRSNYESEYRLYHSINQSNNGIHQYAEVTALSAWGITKSNRLQVSVKNIDIPFVQLVWLIFKFVLASIPAIIFAWIVIIILGVMFSGVLVSMSR